MGIWVYNGIYMYIRTYNRSISQWDMFILQSQYLMFLQCVILYPTGTKYSWFKTFATIVLCSFPSLQGENSTLRRQSNSAQHIQHQPFQFMQYSVLNCLVRQIGKFFYPAGTVDPGIPHDFFVVIQASLLLGAPKLLLQNFIRLPRWIGSCHSVLAFWANSALNWRAKHPQTNWRCREGGEWGEWNTMEYPLTLQSCLKSQRRPRHTMPFTRQCRQSADETLAKMIFCLKHMFTSSGTTCLRWVNRCFSSTTAWISVFLANTPTAT